MLRTALLALLAATTWQSQFAVDKKNLGITAHGGSNPYFNLTPGYVLFFQHGKTTDTLTVLAETRKIDGVECRIVEDREMKDGQIVEVTRDYYAIDSATSDVYYMGEEVDIYKNGKVSGHAGTWLSGVNGAKFGLMMPASPKLGQRFYQEQAQGVGMDRIEILSVTERATTPAGSFEKCVHVVETSPLEKSLKDHKVYCPAVGMVRDAEMQLVKYGMK